MPDSTPSAEAVVREIYANVARGDFTAVTARLAPEAEFIQAESLPFGGRFVGAEGFASMAARIVAAWPGFAVAPIAFLSDGAERVVVLTELTGAGLQMPMLEYWTVRDGQVRRCQPFYFDTAAAARTAAEAAGDRRPG